MEETKPTDNPLATIIITVDTKTGETRMAGNCLVDSNYVLRCLITAANMLINNEGKAVERPLVSH